MNLEKVYILEDRAILYINGSDSDKYLQNLISNDIGKVNESKSCFASLLTPQGKFLFDFIVVKHKDGYFLDCEKKVVDQLYKKLITYKLRSKVEILNLSNEFVVAALSHNKFLSIEGAKDELGYTLKYNEDHVYFYYFTSDGPTEQFGFQDGLYIDNGGSLQIQIWQRHDSIENDDPIVIHVPNDYTSLQDAIDAASNGDTVRVGSGRYYEDSTIEIVGKYIYLVSENGPDDTYISGENSHRALFIDHSFSDTCHVVGFTIENGRPGADNHASAIKVTEGSKTVFKNLTIENNGGGSGNTVAFGGGIESTTFTDCIIRNNSVENYGGLRNSTNVRCILYGNNGWNNTSVLLEGNSINCTVYGNGGGYSSGLWGGSAVNCIFYYNSGSASYGDVSITYSNIQGGHSGEGNINSDPLFVDVATDDFRLQEGSPCIDAGDPDSPIDPDGTVADMGAVYYNQAAENTGYSLSFSGVNDHVSTEPWFNGVVNEYSIVMNLQMNEFPDEHEEYVMLHRAHFQDKRIGLDYNTNKLFASDRNGSGVPFVQVDYDLDQLEVGVWYNVAFMANEDSLKLFINGTLVDMEERTFGDSDWSSSYYWSSIGGGAGYGGDPNVNISEVSIWAMELSSDDLLSYMDNSPTGSESNLAALWRFNEGYGNVSYDGSGNGNDNGSSGSNGVSGNSGNGGT